MALLDTDIIIILFYLFFTMLIGYFSGKKIKHFSQYAVYDRNYHTFMLVATIFATMIGGNSIIGSVTESYSAGLLYIIVTFGFSVKPLIISEFIAPRIKRYFKNAISIGEIFQGLYGKKGKITSGIFVAANSIASVSVQIFAIGSLIHYFMNVSYETGMLIGYGIIVFYSTYGGINSVVKTDLFQFAILIIAIPIIYTESLEIVGGYGNLFRSLPPEKLSFTADMEQFSDKFSLFLTFCFFYITPTIIQRVLLSKSPKQARNSFRMASFIGIFLSAIVVLIGLIGFVLNPELDSNNVLFYLIDNVMPVGIRGIIISGLIAVIMSTADSHLNVAGVAIVNDIIKPIFKGSLEAKKELIYARLITFTLGSSTLLIALMYKNILKIVVFSAYFWTTILFVPFVFGIWGYVLTIRNFFICVAFGSFASIIWNIFLVDKFSFNGIIPITFADIFLFVILYQFGGRRVFKGGKKPDANSGPGLLKYPGYAYESVKTIFSLDKIIDRVNQKVQYYGRQYYLTFGFVGMAIYIIPYFMWSYNGSIRHIEITLRAVACALCFCLVIWAITKGEENAKKSRYLPLYWYFTLFFCLPFMSTYLTIDSQANDNFWILNTVVSTFILTLLVDWMSFVIIMIAGVGAAFATQAQVNDDFSLSIIQSYDYVIYAAICTSFLSYLILYLKELDMKKMRRITNLLKTAVNELKQSKIQLEEKNQEMYEKNSELEETKLKLKEANALLMKNVEEKTTHLENALTKNEKISSTLRKSHSDNINTDRKLAEALEYKKEIFHNISHEVRTPIQGIISVSEVLQESWSKFADSEKLEYVNMIAKSGARLMTFLSDLLEVAKFDSGKMLLDFEKNDLKKAAEDIIEESEALCVGKNIVIKLEIDEKAEYVASFDILRIKQVIRNLISNAIKFSDEGQIIVRISNKKLRFHENDKASKHLCFSVIDNGIGIDKNDLSRIFEPFQQGSNTKTGAGGTGLGLSICQSIINYHKGVIWAENNFEKGVTFSFALPFQNDLSEINISSDGSLEKSSKELTILVIEDEAILRNALNMIISSFGVKVIEAEGGLEGLKQLEKNHEEIDLILMDMMMPDIYGLDLIRVIKKEIKLKDIPIVLQSGMVDANEIEKAYGLGAIGYIAKPYNKEEILRTIKKVQTFDVAET